MRGFLLKRSQQSHSNVGGSLSAVRGGTIKTPANEIQPGGSCDLTSPQCFHTFSPEITETVGAFLVNMFEAFNYIVCLCFLLFCFVFFVLPLLVLMKSVNLPNQFHTDRKVTFHLLNGVSCGFSKHFSSTL